MRLSRYGAFGLTGLLLAAGALTAQEPPANPPQSPPAGEKKTLGSDDRDEMSGRVWRATKLLNANVKDAKGERIGEIEDLVIDKEEGRVVYGVLSFGGFLDIGDKLFAIPFATIVRTDDENVVVMNVTKEQLQAAPSFPKDRWPEFDRKYGTSVHDYYKTPPYWTDRYHAGDKPTDPARLDKDALDKERMKAHGTCRATKLIGTNVEDPQDKNLGEIDDVVIDDASGRVAYAVLSFGGFLGMGDKLFAIPFDSLRPHAKDEDKLVLDVSKEKLKAAPGFDKNSWPNMADRRWGSEIHKYYENEPYWERDTQKSDRGGR